MFGGSFSGFGALAGGMPGGGPELGGVLQQATATPAGTTQLSGLMPLGAGAFPGLSLAGPCASSGLGVGFPTAPSGPALAGTVAVSARGGGQGTFTPIVPVLLRALLEHKALPFGFEAFLETLGADEGVTTDTFLLVSDADLTEALSTTEVDGVRLSAIGRARITGVVREIFAECGAPAPGLGTTSVPALAAPRAETLALTAGPTADLVQLAPSAVNLAQTVDQAIKGQARRLSFTELRDYRLHFEMVTGAAPPEHALPTSDQLAGLRALLLDGRVPYVDFAVWSALGPRVAKFQKTEATVLIGGAFVTKVLDAPSSFAAWEDSWALFAVAMVTLNAARPGSLGAYLDGIKTLFRHFPTKWAAIVSADLVVRSERWLRIREDIERAPPAGFDPAAPWDYVIAASSYGRGGSTAMWWHTHVELPLTLGASSPFAGLPSTSASSSSGSRPTPTPPATAGSRRGAKGGQPDRAKESCHSWNAGVGVCAGDGPCPAGRRHVCRLCGDSHRASHYHKKEKANKGKGKSNKDKRKDQHRDRRGDDGAPAGR